MKRKIGIVLCIVLLIVLVLGVYIAAQKESAESVADAGAAKNAAVVPESLTYMGTEYPMKDHLQSVLLIGTDDIEGHVDLPEDEQDFFSYHQADFLMLLVLDNDSQTVELIHLNRDTMADVPWLDVFGDYGGTEFMQLCLAFNSGSGGRDSCKNTVHAVSSLMFDIPIDGYIQIPMTAIPVLNDLVGGVPVAIVDDLTVIDPAFVQGTTIKLTGAQAEKFVRARKTLVDDTNISRMRRQRDYMESFQTCARKSLNTDSEFVLKLLEKLSSYLQSDMTGQQLSGLIEKLDNYTVSPIRYTEGELIIGEEYYEFYVDTASLWELVERAYCQ